MYFLVAGVELNPLLPVLLGAVASLIFGQVGLTGGIATLPIMISVFNFTTPSVTATNLIFVLISPLGSVFSYWREKRILWRLGFLAALGGIAGSLIGPRIRVGPLSDIWRFQLVFGVLLALLGWKLYFRKHPEIKIGKVERTSGFLLRQEFIFSGNTYSYSPSTVLFAGFVAGALSTTFGIGSGFLLMPFYTTVLKLPIYAVASSALLSTLIISASGTIVYSSLNTGLSTAPDLKLGLLLGAGGILGGYASAKFQRRVSSRNLHRVLGATLFLWALAYLIQGF